MVEDYPCSLLKHPIAIHKLSLLRKDNLSSSKCYSLAKELGMCFAYDLTREFELTNKGLIYGKKPAVIAMLRSGMVLLEGFRTLIPNIKIGHLGVYKQEGSGEEKAILYLVSVPELNQRPVIILDMSINTGVTAIKAITEIKQLKDSSDDSPIIYGSVVTSIEGAENIKKVHNENNVKIVVVSKGHESKESNFGHFSNKIYGLTPAQ